MSDPLSIIGIGGAVVFGLLWVCMMLADRFGGKR